MPEQQLDLFSASGIPVAQVLPQQPASFPAVTDLDEVLVSTSATFPLVGLTAVAWMLELLEVVPTTTDPGRMNRLKFPIA